MKHVLLKGQSSPVDKAEQKSAVQGSGEKIPIGGVEQIQFGMLHGSVDVVRNGRKD